MNEEVEPIVGTWYRNVSKRQRFTVIGVDEDEDIIEIQYVDGEIDEIDTETWERMELEVIDEPDEWRGALDEEDEDLDDEDDEDDEDEDEDEDEDGDWRRRGDDDWDE